MNDSQILLRDALVGRLSGCEPDSSWSALYDAGVLGLRVSEAQGGLGLELAEAEPVFDALGELCLPVPYLETAIIAAGLAGRLAGEASDALLTRIAAGGRVAVAGVEPGLDDRLNARGEGGHWRLSGTARIVVGAMDADELLVLAQVEGEHGPALFIAGQGWRQSRRPVPTIDRTMAGDIGLDDLPATRLPGDASSAVEQVRDEATAAICIEAAALMRRLVRDTVGYARQREQFGQPIGAFQVVRHRLVDMNIQARRASAIAGRAIMSLKAPAPVRGRAVSAAKVTVCRTGRYVGQNAVQLHGGMGMTDELAVGRCFRRLTMIEAQLGSADHHLRRFQRLGAAA